VNLLILNSGSSSIKFSLYATSEAAAAPRLLLDDELTGTRADDPTKAITHILNTLASHGPIDAVGYRVVHPGPDIHTHVLLTDAVLHKLEAAATFAPLHDPEALTIIREVRKRLPHIPHVACFDTIFHQTMPEEASLYAIPELYRRQGVRRYGFHGLSCESILRQLEQAGPVPARLVIAHLGSGCSVTAVQNGHSIDTTMGLTPTGGIVMGTRPGDLDPGLMLYLLRQQHGDPVNAVETMLNHHAGMVALTNLPNDMQAVRKAAAAGDKQALLALKVFTRSIRKAIGGYAWLMGGLDAIVFTGGIGQHDAATRAEVLAESEVSINSARNHAKSDDLRLITASHSTTAVYVAPAQEDLVIALHVQHMVTADTSQHNGPA